MKHITAERFEKIIKAAGAVADLEDGCRERFKTREKEIIRLSNIYCRECKELPEMYIILYSQRTNLGTRKWRDMCKETFTELVFEETFVRETEKSVIIVRPDETKKTISKEKIIAYIW